MHDYAEALVRELEGHKRRGDEQRVADVLAELAKVDPDLARQHTPQVERAVPRKPRETRKA